MIQRAFQIAALTAVAVAAGLAENKTITGYLVDKACSQELAAKGQKALAGHDRMCSLMGACAKSGFGVVTDDGKFIAFDAAGSKRAAAAIKASKKEEDYKVTVTGDQQGETIKVASLKIQ
jgi:hypothetical protein